MMKGEDLVCVEFEPVSHGKTERLWNWLKDEMRRKDTPIREVWIGPVSKKRRPGADDEEVK